MATKTLVPVEEYLRMSFDGPEPEYLDGEIVERHLGSFEHSEAQERLLEFFRSLKQSFQLFAYPELTLRISPTRRRIADIAVLVGPPPAGQRYPTDPPAFTIEIVSEDDRQVEILEKLVEYHTWGVKHIWVVDPWMRKFFVYDSGGYHEVPSFDLPEFGAKISTAEIFR
jgi:Uma2 family endonuclease